MRAIGEGADAQFRALKIGENADRALGFMLDLADDAVTGGDFIMAAMAHIQPEDIGARFEERFDRGFVR